MGTGGTVQVSDQQVAQWIAAEQDQLGSIGDSSLRVARSQVLVSDAFVVAESRFGHVAHQGDFGISRDVATAISQIADAVFHDGRHHAVLVPIPVSNPEASVAHTSPVSSAAPTVPASAAVRAVGEACVVSGQQVSWGSQTVLKWLTQPPATIWSEQLTCSRDLGCGFSLVVVQLLYGKPGPDTPSTGKGFVETVYAFSLVYSHSAFLKYEQAKDAALIAKLLQEIEDKRAVTRAALRSDDPGQSAQQAAVDQFWSDSLQIMNGLMAR